MWAREIGISFDLLSDKGGEISRRYDLLSIDDGVTDKAVVVINRGRIVLRQEVTETEIPDSVYEVLAASI